MRPIQLLVFIGSAASVAYALADPIGTLKSAGSRLNGTGCLKRSLLTAAGLQRNEDAILQLDQVDDVTTATVYRTVVATVTACDLGNCTAGRSTATVTSVVEATSTVCPLTSSAIGVPNSSISSSSNDFATSPTQDTSLNPTPPETRSSSTPISTTVPSPGTSAPSTLSMSMPPAPTSSVAGIPSNATDSVSTIRITSFITESVTSVITIPELPTSSAILVIPSSSPSNSSVVGPSSSHYGVIPPVGTGTSGFPLPSGNLTWPSPTLTPTLISGASTISGKASTVAVVAAFAVAFNSKWLPFILCLGNAAAQISLEEAPSDIRKLIAHPKLISLPIVHVMAVFALFVIMHWVRFMLTRFEPPHNAEREQAVVDIVSGRDDSDEEVSYFTAMHYKVVENQLAEASQCR